jgi:hypothetical protein
MAPKAVQPVLEQDADGRVSHQQVITRRPHRKRPIWIAVTLMVLATLAIMLIPQLLSSGAPSPTGGGQSDPRLAIARATVRQAMAAERRTLDIGVPRDRQPNAAEIERYRTRAKADLRKYFDGAALQTELDGVDRVAADVGDPGFRSWGGGADSFKFTSTDAIGADFYRVKGSLRSWASMAQVQDGNRLVEANPSGFIDVTIEVRIPLGTPHGKVSKFDWEFQPGSRP